jgi:hypothetical protein
MSSLSKLTMAALLGAASMYSGTSAAQGPCTGNPWDPRNPGCATDYGRAPLLTGRSAAVGGIGLYCETPRLTCRLAAPADIGGACSCAARGGRRIVGIARP